MLGDGLMKHIKLPFSHIDLSKLSVCFTWDDNFLFHSSLIAPEFVKRRMPCTFYINPGEAGFEEKFLPGYRDLSEMGFDIGSHGFKHDNYSHVPLGEFERELESAASAIRALIGIYPATFAFPYHDFNDQTLRAAKSLHLETRNTLGNSRRFGIKSDSAPDEMFEFIKECVSRRCSVVFSGHSAIPQGPKASRAEEDLGYNPVPIGTLRALLDHIQTLEIAEVLTFEQAALKQYIINNCAISNGSYTLNQRQLDWLDTFHIGAEKLFRLI